MKISTIKALISKLEKLKSSQTNKKDIRIVEEIIDSIQKECRHLSANTRQGHPVGICPDCKRRIKLSRKTLVLFPITGMFPERD